MKKTISFLVITLVMFFSSVLICRAAGISVNESLSSKQVVVGNTVTVSVKISSSSPIGAINYSVSYDDEKLTHVSGVLNDVTDDKYGQTSFTLTFKFRAKASGNAYIGFSILEAYDTDLNSLTWSNTSATVNIVTQAEIQASYSKNNYLSYLGVDNFEISPAFDKDTDSYSLTVENEVTAINVSGNREDSKSSVSGLGEYGLEEGNNIIEVVVTAQNGSSRTYTLNVTRNELSPIVVKVDDKDYNVVRKAELITAPDSSFLPTTIKINEEDVPAFINEKIETTLVGLKDAEGNISLYSYKDDEYTPYVEFAFNSIIITQSDDIEIPKKFEKVTIKIGNTDVTAYKYKDDKNNDNFYIIGAKNVNTGEENLYQYDSKENTIQILNTSLFNKVDKLVDDNNIYMYIILGLGTLLIVTYLFFLFSMIKKKKKDSKKKEEKEKKEEVKEDKKQKKENKEEEPVKEVEEEKEVTKRIALKEEKKKREKSNKEIAKKEKR